MEDRLSAAVSQFRFLAFHEALEIYPSQGSGPLCLFQTDRTSISSMPSRAPLALQRVLAKPLRLAVGFLMSLHHLDLHETLTAVLCPHRPCGCHDGDVQTLQHHPNAGVNQGTSQGAFLQCQAMPLPLSSPVLEPFSLPSELPSAGRGGFLRRSAPRPASS